MGAKLMKVEKVSDSLFVPFFQHGLYSQVAQKCSPEPH